MKIHNPSALEAHEALIFPGMRLGEYLMRCKEEFPLIYQRLNHDFVNSALMAGYVENLGTFPAHFESEDEGGRGDTYRQSQMRHPLARATGIQQLFDLFADPGGQLHPAMVILDLLGGNGTLTRAARCIYASEQTPTIITSDLSAEMVRDALSKGLPAIRQAAQKLLFADQTVDGTLFSYGTHHIPPESRMSTFAEALRVLKPGAQIVVQDFEEDSPTARWYSELLDKYTTTGHDCIHFTREDMSHLLKGAGFEDVRVLDVYDPFVLEAATAEEARKNMLDHVTNLFGLQVLLPDAPEDKDYDRLEKVLEPFTTFTSAELPRDRPTVQRLTLTPTVNGFRAELPRVALVATGRRPA